MFSNPEQIVAQLGLVEGMRVADLGAGSGFYTKAAARRVGTTGHVYAIEVQKGMLKTLEDDLKKDGIKNVDCIWGDIEKDGGTKIADRTVDRVIISNVLFQAEDKIGLIDEAKRILKKDGQALLVDWTESWSGMGPAPESVVPQEKAEELFKKRGFKIVEVVSTEVHHYGILFRVE
jgi:ubiquinone/menaquinone biosynthesis C-methylase UbiE